jgi:hypothetical protein
MSASVVSRLQALEEKKVEKDSTGVDFAALLAELCVLNSNVKILAEAMVSHLKQPQFASQQQSKQDGEKTLASSTPDGRKDKEIPAGSLSPTTKKHGSHKGNGSSENAPQVSERTRSNTRQHSQTRSKEVVRPHSPPRGIIHVRAVVPINVPSSSTEDDEDATTVDERRQGSTSLGSDDIFAPPHAKAKATRTTRKKTYSNAQGKGIAKDKALSLDKGVGREGATGSRIRRTSKVCSDGQHGSYRNARREHSDPPKPIRPLSGT